MIFGTTLALDIDDTLTQTARHTIGLAKKEFGHSLSVDELLSTYGQPGDVPEWQTPTIENWLKAHLGSAEYLSTVPVMAGAVEVLTSLSTTFPVVCYITSRQHYTRQKTEDWLQRHAFPSGQLITRDANVKDIGWKLRALVAEFPQPPVLIDDLLGFIPPAELQLYPSSLLWFNAFGKINAASEFTTSVRNWQEISRLLSS